MSMTEAILQSQLHFAQEPSQPQLELSKTVFFQIWSEGLETTNPCIDSFEKIGFRDFNRTWIIFRKALLSAN